MQDNETDLISGADFFDLLCKNDDFCSELGRCTLAAGRLESALKEKLGRASSKDTLGALIRRVEGNHELKRLKPHLETLTLQRNYLTHNIHALLTDLIEETILERKDLVASDTHTYQQRAWELHKNLNSLANMVEGIE